MLTDAFILAVKNLKRLHSKPAINMCFMEIIEKEWKDFIFIDYETLNKAVKSPWSLVPVFEDKHRKKLPEFLNPPTNEYQETKVAIQQFLSLRHMIYHLQWRSGVDKLKDFPFNFEERDVYSWKINETVKVESDKVLVLGSLQLGDEVGIRYVVLDPEFFILIEPNFQDELSKTIHIEIKAPLEKVDIIIDGNDSKRLTIGVNELNHKGEKQYHKFLLHFENAVNSRSVRKTIEDNKKMKKYFLDTLILSFLDRGVEEVRDNDAL